MYWPKIRPEAEKGNEQTPNKQGEEKKDDIEEPPGAKRNSLKNRFVPKQGGSPVLSTLPYNQMIRVKNNKFFLRLQICRHAKTNGIHSAARHYGCSRNTVRLWLRRFESQGTSGLRDLSRAPKTCPHKTSPHHEKKVLEARRQAAGFGPQRLKDDFGLKPSVGAISRILRQHGMTRKTKKKSQKKNDLRKINARYKVFERVQADTKPLFDIPNYWPQMKLLKLPMHQYTHRDVKSGALFIDYGNELSTTYACLSSKRILEHLKK